MKIMIISRYLPFPGGRENFVHEFINELKNNHEVCLVTPDGLIGSSIQFFRYKQDYSYLEEIILSVKPDIINCHTFYLCNFLQDIAKKHKIPFILTVHGDQFSIGDIDRQKTLIQSLSNSDHIITVCKAGKESLLKNTIIPDDKISIILNGVNTNLFAKYDFSNRSIELVLRKNLGIPLDYFVYITPVRMIWYKGLDFLVDTIIKNKQVFKKQKIFFLITTPNTSTSPEEIEYMNTLSRSITDHDLEGFVKIIFAGYEFMPYLYQAVNAFVLPSKSEQFPISILEAMSSELPVIATDVGGVSEIIKHYKNGLLVQHGDTRSLYGFLLRLNSDKDLKNTLSKKAKEEITDKYNIKQVANEYVLLFKKIILLHSTY